MNTTTARQKIVYATETGFKLVTSNNKEIFERESITQIPNDHESEPRLIGVGVGGSNNENEEDKEQLLPTTKRMRTSP